MNNGDWIKTSDQKPELDKNVLLFGYSNYARGIPALYVGARYNDAIRGRGWFLQPDGYLLFEPTYWMPLPDEP